MEDYWVRCKVSLGMFSNERLVVIEVPGRGEIASLIVDTNLVIPDVEIRANQSVPGRLRVSARPQERADTINVILPVSSVELGRVVAIPANLFV